MKVNSLNDLYLEQLKDLYDAEQQLIKALPKMAKASFSAELRGAFEEHIEKTKEHARRIETIFEGMGEKAKGPKCKAMEGLVKEGSEVIEEDMENGVKDAALIAAAQRVEHYEMAGYGCVRTYASLLDTKAAALLEKTLEEEEEKEQTKCLEGSPRKSMRKFLEHRIGGDSRWGTGPVKDRSQQLDRVRVHAIGKDAFVTLAHYFPDGALLQIFRFGFTGYAGSPFTAPQSRLGMTGQTDKKFRTEAL